jgi:hypothetical protein
MKVNWNRTLAIVSMAFAAACSGGQIGNESSSGNDRVISDIQAIPHHPHKRVCERSNTPGIMACHARIRTQADGIVPFAAGPSGLTPADLQSAYKLDVSGGANATIAIVDAQDDPKAEQDLAVYRKTFGLPPCTRSNGCFKKVNQNGEETHYPTPDQGWAGEIALDLDAASAVCPNCKILLVEADSASIDDLGTAVRTAVKLGATVVSNSYGGPEDKSAAQIDEEYYHHPGVAIFVSAGDSGYAVEYPAAGQFVHSVGGTALVKSSSPRGWVESVWGSSDRANGGTGSGCSQFVTKPSWQKDADCGTRVTADIAAVADPNTGVAVYTTYGGNGWAVIGGTSAAAPIVAGIYALTGHGGDDGALAYQTPKAFFDVTTGSNGSCGGSYLCTGKPGFDGPTGNGTPNGSVLASIGDGGGSSGGTPPGGGNGGGGSGGSGGGDPAPGTGQCAHPVCATGGALTSGCDACATAICAQDDYCCTTAWDSTCVSEAASICNLRCR